MKCPNCGNEIEKNKNFCPKCGASVSQISSKVSNNRNSIQKSQASLQKSSTLKKVAIIAGALIVIAVLAVVGMIFLTPDTTITVNDLYAYDDGMGSYKIEGNLIPDKDYPYLEMSVVFYDDNGSVIDKAPLAWNMAGVKKDKTVKISGDAYITSSETPSKLEVYFFDEPYGDDNLDSSIYNETLTFSGSKSASSLSTSSSSSDSLSILSCSFSTENKSDALTYCDAYVGEEHSGENVKISVLYSRDGSNLNNGNIVPKTVDSSGYVSVPSASAFSKFPDNAIVTIYDSSGDILDTQSYDLKIKSGTQTY